MYLLFRGLFFIGSGTAENQEFSSPWKTLHGDVCIIGAVGQPPSKSIDNNEREKIFLSLLAHREGRKCLPASIAYRDEREKKESYVSRESQEVSSFPAPGAYIYAAENVYIQLM